jgi:CheY-like chemotaxis protein
MLSLVHSQTYAHPTLKVCKSVLYKTRIFTNIKIDIVGDKFMPTWMVVEDENDIQDILLSLFELWHIDGLAFSNGDTALNWLTQVDAGEFDDFLPQLAIVDIRLPGASGLEVSARLRQCERLKNIPIVLITAYRMSAEDETEAIQSACADMLLYKPLPTSQDLRHLLDRMLV